MWAVAVQFWQGNVSPNSVLREEKTCFAKEKSTFSEKQKKDLGILTTVSNSDWGSQAPGGNSASHRPGNPVTAVYANYTFGWLSHEVQNKCMSWWSSKLDCSVELKAFTLSETHKRINAMMKVTGIQWEKHTCVSCFILSLMLTAHKHQCAAQCFAALYKQPLKSSNKPSFQCIVSSAFCFQYIVSSVFFTKKIKAR